MMKYSEASLSELSAELIPFIKDYRVILLNGELGAGKTTLVRAIVHSLGGGDNVISPTFSLVNHYAAGGYSIMHSDLYRLGSRVELEQIGFYELMDDADIVFIEWADKFGIKDELERYMEIRIIESADGREYKLNFSDRGEGI